MPIYEYHCDVCSKTIELIQKFSDPPATHCPTCKGPLTKLLSKTSFLLKGTGWYATDYKKPANTGTDKKSTSEADGGKSPPKEKSEAQEKAPPTADKSKPSVKK